MNVERLQQRKHLRAEETVKEFGENQLFHFSDFAIFKLSAASP